MKIQKGIEMTKANKLTLSNCQDGRDLIRYCERKGATVRNGAGDHVIVTTDKGSCAIPSRDLGRGLFCKIVKTLILIGLVLGVLYLIL